MRFIQSIAVLSIAIGFLGGAAMADDAELLTIGSVAPDLDIEHWIHEGEDPVNHVTSFKEGKVYIVEFWATWCGPCISSMPHLVETQEKYADKGVQIISVSDEKMPVIEKFLARTVRGEEEQTYQELTSVYSLTSDPDRSVFNDYMKAAGQNGIPTAFIVGKDGHVEWIGHPMTMDKALASVVEGDWDRKAFAEEFKEGQEIKAAYYLAMRGNLDEGYAALQKLESTIKQEKNKARIKSYLAAIEGRQALALINSQEEGDVEKLAAFIKKADERQLYQIAFTAERALSANSKTAPEMKAAILSGFEERAKADQDSMMIADSFARLLAGSGDFEAGIAYLEGAMEKASDDDKPRVLASLQRLRRAKKTAEENALAAAKKAAEEKEKAESASKEDE